MTLAPSLVELNDATLVKAQTRDGGSGVTADMALTAFVLRSHTIYFHLCQAPQFIPRLIAALLE